jgi:hypothetical protein
MGEPSMEVGAMPKEHIYARDFAMQHRDMDGNKVPVDYTAAKLSWDKDSENVSLAVVNMEGDPDGMDPTVKYLNLNRNGINRLITNLRRARDAAYGKDA